MNQPSPECLLLDLLDLLIGKDEERALLLRLRLRSHREKKADLVPRLASTSSSPYCC
jgi:hypothetical protein